MYGVAVHDNDVITGEVVKSKCSTSEQVELHCGKMEGHTYVGCARAVDGKYFPAQDGKYSIYYVDCECGAWHEYCHAVYEQKSHTFNFVFRAMQGETDAACPKE
jgi:hypothetical protein